MTGLLHWILLTCYMSWGVRRSSPSGNNIKCKTRNWLTTLSVHCQIGEELLFLYYYMAMVQLPKTRLIAQCHHAVLVDYTAYKTFSVVTGNLAKRVQTQGQDPRQLATNLGHFCLVTGGLFSWSPPCCGSCRTAMGRCQSQGSARRKTIDH